MAGPLVLGRAGIHIDGLLAWAVAERAGLIAMPDEISPIEDLPLGRWDRFEGRPIWTASTLQPEGDVEHDARYLHRRSMTPDIAAYSSRASWPRKAGRWKSRRFPYEVSAARRVVGTCYGDRDGVADLLRSVTHIGGKRAFGHGRVAKWTVEEWPGRSTRDAIGDKLVPATSPDDEIISYGGYTPPYWHAPWWRDLTEPGRSNVA